MYRPLLPAIGWLRISKKSPAATTGSPVPVIVVFALAEPVKAIDSLVLAPWLRLALLVINAIVHFSFILPLRKL
jgi:hypothetical protein